MRLKNYAFLLLLYSGVLFMTGSVLLSSNPFDGGLNVFGLKASASTGAISLTGNSSSCNDVSSCEIAMCSVYESPEVQFLGIGFLSDDSCASESAHNYNGPAWDLIFISAMLVGSSFGFYLVQDKKDPRKIRFVFGRVYPHEWVCAVANLIVLLALVVALATHPNEFRVFHLLFASALLFSTFDLKQESENLRDSNPGELQAN